MFTDSSAVDQTTYQYRIEASDDSGDSDPSTAASVTTATSLPAAPSNVTAVAIDPNHIQVVWTNSAYNETGFRVEYQISGSSSWNFLATTNAGATEVTDVGVSPGEARSYQVFATNSAGDSLPGSGENATATTPLNPSADESIGSEPTNVSTSLLSNAIKVQWQAPDSGTPSDASHRT